MQSIGLVLCVHNTQAPASEQGLRAAVDRTWRPLVAAVEAHPHIRLSLHLSGVLLGWLEQGAPDILAAISRLVAEGRIEVVGGLWGGGVVPALPERDIIGQLGALTRWWRTNQDVRLRGAWLPYHGWDGAAARILGRLGFQFTVLEDAQFSPPVSADGYYVTEREGHGLALFAADTRLARLVGDAPPSRLLRAIQSRAERGVRCVTLAISGDQLGAAHAPRAERCFGKGKWVPELFRLLSENAHWIKLVSFGTVVDRMRPTDRAWPPPSISQPVAVSALGRRGAHLLRILAEARRAEDSLMGEVASFLHAGSWEHLLGAYPEVNRLHKRMLRVSLEVLRLRNAVRDGRGDRDPRAALLEDATLALYRGQVGAAYVMGAEQGAQDGAVRDAAWSQIILAEHMAATALGEHERLRHEQVDYDCDGRLEVLVRTPTLCAIVAPGEGGALVELDGWSLPGNVLNVRTRREEPEHADLLRSENLPALYQGGAPTEEAEPEPGEIALDVRELVPLPVSETGLAERVVYDRHVRASFVDRFLGAEATLENVARGRFPEAGDFVGADYQVLQVEDAEEGSTVLSLGRDGHVNEGSVLRLIRVVKRYIFQRDLPVIDVRYEVSNRYHEPVRSRFAVELNLNLDSQVQPACWLEAGSRRLPLTEPGEVADCSDVALVGASRGFRLTVQTQPDARLWFFPIETVSRSPSGLARGFQGVSLLFWWPVELWGLERKRVDLSLSLEHG